MISVLMPLFNGASTVLTALASLQSQTFQDWECVIVDDGSTDDSATLVHTVDDDRIRYYRLDRNRGRGYARQHCLQNAAGRYVAFLDADDWIYPDKFQQQIACMKAESNIQIVSTGMAIADSAGNLAGVRSADAGSPVLRPPMKNLGMPPLAFAPTMMSAELARNTGFDTSFPTAEDVDFLLRAILGKPFAVLPVPLYVYREHDATTLAKTVSALNHCCRMFAKQSDRQPFRSRIEIARARAKQMVYYSASATGLWNSLIARRSRRPHTAEYLQYQRARHAVSRIASSYSCEVSGISHEVESVT
jgi:glycosyltransferase involved in cell wall biosynthesis